MAGGLMQLVAYGENIEQTVNGTAANSGRVSVTVARNGDLVGDMYLELESDIAATATAEAGDCNWVAERAVSSVELSIGGQRIDKHYQKWWRLYSELYLDEAKKATWGKMTTAADGSTVYLPLVFFFNRNPGLYLPLIALQYHEVRIDIDLASDFDTFLNKSVFKVWANYVYLDTEERRRFAQKGHEYLIEQVQHTGTDTVDAANTKQVRLSYNHPVKELVWCFSNTAAKSSLWNFTAKNLVTEVALQSDQTASGLDSNCFVPVSNLGTPMYATELSTEAFTEENAGQLDTFKLVLNGQDRFKEQKGKYFNQVQAYNHHSGCPAQARGAPAYRHLQLLPHR